MKPGCPIYCLFTMILTLDECIHPMEAFTRVHLSSHLSWVCISMRFTFLLSLGSEPILYSLANFTHVPLWSKKPKVKCKHDVLSSLTFHSSVLVRYWILFRFSKMSSVW